MEDQVKYRSAALADVPAIRALYEDVIPQTYDDAFWRALAEGVKAGTMPGKTGRLAVVVATRRARVIGAVVAHSLNLADARAARMLPFDVLEGAAPADSAAYVMLLGVDRGSRREGVATDLMFEGVVSLVREDATVKVVLLHCLADSKASNGLYESLHYTLLGHLPAHFSIGGVQRGANVWAQALGGSALVAYAPAAGGGAPDLTNPRLPETRTRRRLPGWLRTVLLQGVLPLAIVSLMFAYLYVRALWRGPRAPHA